MKKQFFLFYFLLLFLPGCIQKSINVQPLSRLPIASKPDFEEEQNNIFVKVKKLQPEECSEIFGINTIKCGIQPIILFIRNNSNNIIYFSPETTALPLVAPYHVAKKCHWKNLEISGISSYLAILYQWELLIPIACCSYFMKDKNTKITDSISQYAINSWDSIKILPSETLNKVIFVENINCPKSFRLAIFSKDTKETINFFAQLN
ncbi:hypothetical protein A3F66_05995 [candidate division TM6 bacterium RIFCSPHIGHO2_12_FULL_32_22]|nr:MAG: hypothetical protein A3F66_05995 [candidate division TM6 bacterium RIFCSPHIGHO2_12_FULL_32_22]